MRNYLRRLWWAVCNRPIMYRVRLHNGEIVIPAGSNALIDQVNIAWDKED